MSINNDYQTLIKRILQQIDLPAIAEIHLPTAGDERDDEFGFIFLEDGSVGPFYTRLDDTLAILTTRLGNTPAHKPDTTSLKALLDLFSSSDIADRALALGAFNAMSAHLMHRAGFSPAEALTSTGRDDSEPGELIGMVGYFCPLVDRLLSRGCKVMIIEKRPERVQVQPGVEVSTDPEALAPCRTVLCTASTLINDTLDEILAAASQASDFNLIGPSSSGLPDVAFAHGVTSTGGVAFEDTSALKQALENNDSWGKAGKKYQLTPESYPGIDVLLDRL